MKRIVALAFWALWARESLTVGHHRMIFGMEEKGGRWGCRKRTNQSELDGEDVGLGLAIGGPVRPGPAARCRKNLVERRGNGCGPDGSRRPSSACRQGHGSWSTR